jgi:hypothetical protein
MKEVNYPDLPTPKEFLEGKNLLGTLGKAEAEEMFEMILRFSLEANKWVAPDFDELVEAIKKKNEAINKNAEAMKRNAIRKSEFEKKKKKWNWLYKLIGKKLMEPEYEKVVNIFSVMPINPNTPVDGLQFMRRRGFLNIEDGIKRTHYAVLTSKALATLRK